MTVFTRIVSSELNTEHNACLGTAVGQQQHFWVWSSGHRARPPRTEKPKHEEPSVGGAATARRAGGHHQTLLVNVGVEGAPRAEVQHPESRALCARVPLGAAAGRPETAQDFRTHFGENKLLKKAVSS